MSISLADQSWLQYQKKEKITENDKMMYLYDIIENSLPIYKFTLNKEDEFTHNEIKSFRDWYFSTIEGKTYDVDFKTIFDCWFDKLQLQSNIKLLNRYKDVVYNTLIQHRNIDNEVHVLMKKSYDNLNLINELLEAPIL
jgi:hypothetical protein